MPAYKSKSRHIRDALIVLLQGINYDAGGGSEPAFGLVTSNPSAETNQEPYALVYPAQIADTKGAVGQNDRAVGYAIFIELNLETANRTQDQTFNYMYDLTELVLDTLDSGDFHDSLNAQDSSIGTWLMDVSRSTFRPAKSKTGAVLLCTIDITVSYSKNL